MVCFHILGASEAKETRKAVLLIENLLNVSDQSETAEKVA